MTSAAEPAEPTTDGAAQSVPTQSGGAATPPNGASASTGAPRNGAPASGAPSNGAPAGASARPDATGADTAPGNGTGVASGDLVPVDAITREMSETLAALADDELPQSERRRLLGRLAAEVRARGVGDLFRPKAAVRWMSDLVSDVAPRLPIRPAQTLRRHFPGLTDEELAERLVRNAARTTAAVGAASGGVASIEWVATPSLLTAPVLLATETVAVVAVEIKLIGELHEIYGAPIAGTRAQRAVALLQAWAQRRGVNPLLPGVGVTAVLGTAARKELRDRLLRRFGRNLTTYGPILTGAAVASYLNRRATIALGDQIRRDLRGHRQIEG